MKRLPFRFLCSAVSHRLHRDPNRPIRYPRPIDGVVSRSFDDGVADLMSGQDSLAVIHRYAEVELRRRPLSLLHADPVCLSPVVVSLLAEPPCSL